MTKIKKIVAAMLATMTLATSAIGITANAAGTRRNDDAEATFSWGNGYSKMINNSATQRYCSAYVNVFNNITGAYITQGRDEGSRGYGGSAYATVNGYSNGGYNFTCYGSIRSGNVVQSPVDWSQTEYSGG